VRLERISCSMSAGPEGEFQGAEIGSAVSIIFARLDGAGGGPKLHRHPYSETCTSESALASPFKVG
jgi:hypothetical protein